MWSDTWVLVNGVIVEVSFFDIPDIGPGELWIHGAGVAQFKTSFAFNWALHLSTERKKRVAFASMEHPASYCESRMIQMFAAAKFEGDERAALMALREGGYGSFLPFEWGDMNYDGVENVIVDSVTLAPGNAMSIIRGLKKFAVTRRVSIFATLQLGRAALQRAEQNGGRHSLVDFPTSFAHSADRVTASVIDRSSPSPRVILSCLKDRDDSFYLPEPEVDWDNLLVKIPDPPMQGPVMSRFHIIESL